MEIYLAAPKTKILKTYFNYRHEKPNILISMKEFLDEPINLMKTIKDNEPYVGNIILDSGGFSTLTIEDPEIKNLLKNKYVNFLEEYGNYIDRTFKFTLAFDDIYGDINFDKNLDWYDEQHLIYSRIVPIIHNIDENSSEDVEYEAYSPSWMAIGKCPNKTNTELLNKIIKRIRVNSKFHFLGVTAPSVLTKIIVDSCDSRSWMKFPDTGSLYYFYTKEGNIVTERIYFSKNLNKKRSGAIEFDEFDKKEDILNIASLFEYTYNDLFNENQNIALNLISIYSYMRLQEMMTIYYENINSLNNKSDSQ